MAAVHHLVRLARSCKLLCIPAALSPCTCDTGSSVCCVLLHTINGTFAMGHGFLSLTSTCHVTHVLYFKNNVKFDHWPHSCVLDHNITMPVHWLHRAALLAQTIAHWNCHTVKWWMLLFCVCELVHVHRIDTHASSYRSLHILQYGTMIWDQI
jgi:hypothetical protein